MVIQPEEVLFFNLLKSGCVLVLSVAQFKSDNIVSTRHNVMLEIVADDNHLFKE